MAAKKTATRKKEARTGDVLAVRISPTMNAYVQVLSTYPRESGAIGVFPLAAEEHPDVSVFEDLTVDGFRHVQLTGVAWDHWHVIGNLPAKLVPEQNNTGGATPCQVATWNVVKTLKKQGLLPADFATYKQIRASHPKIRDDVREFANRTMTYLQAKDLLSPMGLEAFATGKAGEDFMLTSDLFTDQGKAFYAVVFVYDYAADTMQDTEERLDEYWDKFTATVQAK